MMGPHNDGGRLLVLEGPDDVGKTTLAAHLAESLRALAHEVEVLSFPGGDPGSLGSVVYQIHHDPESVGISSPMSKTSLQALHVAAHIDAIESRILPLLSSGTHVVLDRFWWSTWVYGRVSRLPIESLDLLIAAEVSCWGDRKPEPLFLISRFQSGSNPELMSNYQQLAEEQQGEHPIFHIRNEGTIDQAVQQILSLITGSSQNTIRGT